MREMSQTKSNPNGVPYYSPGLPDQREGYSGFACNNKNTTLKGLPNTLLENRLGNPFRVVFINERKPRVGSFVANPGLYYETPLGFIMKPHWGFSKPSHDDVWNMTEH